jgi:hypothetical protein
MIHLKPSYFLATVVALIASTFASATPVFATLAWTHGFVQGPSMSPLLSKVTADPAGNIYLLSQTTGATQGFDLIRMNNAAVVTLSQHEDFGTIAPVFPTSIRTSPNPQGGLPNIYVCAQILNSGNSPVTYLAKFNSAGGLTWSLAIGGATSGISIIPKGFDVDTNGNVYVATSTKFGPGKFELEMFEYSTAGVQTSDKINQTIAPTQCFHVSTNWVTYNSQQWGVFSQSTGNQLAGQNIPFVTNGSKVTSFDFIATPQRDSSILLVKNTTVSDSVQHTDVYSHVVLCLSNAGGVAWVSPTFNEVAIAAEGNGISDPAYVMCTSAGGGNFLQQLNGSGPNAGKEIKEAALPPNIATANRPQADASGVFVYTETAPHDNSVTVKRFDTGLNQILSQTTSGTATLAASVVSDSCILNGNLYMTTELDNLDGSTDTYDAEVQRFAPGITLSQLTPSATSVKGGTTFTLKVQLNAPAPAGGLLVTLSANSGKLAFSNNSQLLTLAIPAGSIYAPITVKTGAVASDTGVHIQANQNGVIRDLAITLTH